MKETSRKSPVRITTGFSREILFFVSFYLFLWLVIDSRFIYYGNGIISDCPVFFSGWTFFRETAFQPGGFVIYISGFLSEFLYYAWTGALVITALALCLYETTKAIINKTGARRFQGLAYVLPILVLILYSRYTHHITLIMAVLAALVFTYLYLDFRFAGKAKSFLLFLFMSIVLYMLAAAAYFVFAALCVIYELFFGRRWLMCALYLLSAAAIAYSEGVIFFNVSIIEAFSDLLAFSWKIVIRRNPRWEETLVLLYILCFFVPAVAILLGILRVFIKKEVFFTGRPSKSILKRFLATAFLFLLAGGAVFYSYDGETRGFLAVNYYAWHSEWDKLLKASRSCWSDFYVMHAVNRALYHTGRLATDMFAFPQHPGAMSFEEEVRAPSFKWKRFDTHMEFGALNLAEMDLTRCLELNGRRPMILQDLALIKMAKGDLDSARVYLGALSQTIFYSGWAKRYLAQLESDPNFVGDERIRYLRQNMLKKDPVVFESYHYDEMLEGLLEANKHNRMAFEYLMAWYLLNGQVDKIASNIGRLNDFNYMRIPRLYEEALLLYKGGGKTEVDLQGWEISAESAKRFNDFIEIYNRYSYDKYRAAKELWGSYGYSFLFYRFFSNYRQKKPNEQI
ncbi:MAG: hypothetical protein JW749_02785 [Sedimentisphaerales bacterium]|nr:hypothetical protein [Sedimentisphaerales bacterium]